VQNALLDEEEPVTVVADRGDDPVLEPLQ